ncbi:MAG TPA: glycosyl hydrolase 115 family protein [Pseudonocardiaceae bacterium]
MTQPSDEPTPFAEFARRRFLALMALVSGGIGASAIAAPTARAESYLDHRPGLGRFPLVAGGRAAPLVVSGSDYPGVVRAVRDLSADVNRVTGVTPEVVLDQPPGHQNIVLVGTIGRSPLIDHLIESGKLDVSGIAGNWETSLEQVIANPMPGVRSAFVIAGSDQRGSIFGVYDVSKGIGVSPWYWWNDVPAQHRDEIHVLPGRHSQGTPVVKYRGFFINDENPDLGTWAPALFGPGLAPGFPGGFNSKFYAKIFETMLRLKANYLWPAVWGRAFAEDDPQNHTTATAYGIIMGTSHEAPMLRGIEEWNRHAVPAVRDANGNIVTPGHDPFGGTGEWSFRHNADAIKAYWTDGIRRMVQQNIEGVVTIGMRGNGDTSLPDGGGIDLMRQIIATERQILAEVTGRDVTTIPQVWTLYKEVQRYWAEGLRPPDDVIAVFTDDNWGNIRKLPDPTLPARSGGYGLYYHFDYVGGGRDYKWVDTSLIANTWEQLHQAVGHGVTRLWVANVGDVKGNELPLQFFLDYAWNPDRWPVDQLSEWERGFAAQNFGAQQAEAIAAVLHTYGRLQSRRKPELLNRHITVDSTKNLATDPSAVVYDDQATPFSLTDYQELDTITEQWQNLATEAERLGRALPTQYQDAYYELVLYEVKATANLYALRQAEFTNIPYAAQGRSATNDLAAIAEARLADDLAMANFYNTKLANGKWQNFQLQPHIDYGDVARYGPNAPWQQPELNNVALADVIFPAVQRIQVPSGAELGVAVDGSDQWWPASSAAAVLPTFSPFQSQPPQFIEIFNRGQAGFDYQIHSGARWLHVSPNRGRVDKQVRATVRVDWPDAPNGISQVPITVTGPNGSSVVVTAVVHHIGLPAGSLGGFVEANGYVSIEADHFTHAANTDSVTWQRIPDIGRTGAGMTPFPVTAPSQTPGGSGPRLDYRITLFTTGPMTVWAYLSPRNNVLPTDGLHYAVSIDDKPPQIVNITTTTGADDTTMNRQWERNTSDNVNRTSTTHIISTSGTHVLKFWMVDPTVVVQKLVVDTDGLRPSYLGPPESMRLPAR